MIDLLEEKGKGFCLTDIASKVVQRGVQSYVLAKDLANQLEILKNEKTALAASRQKMVTQLQAIAEMVGVKYPDAGKIMTAIAQLKAHA